MKVTVTTLSDEVFILDVSPDLELENFKAFCEVESNHPASQMVIVFNGRPLVDDKKTLRHHGVKDGDMVLLQRMQSHPGSGASTGHNVPSIDWGSIQVQGGSRTQQQQQRNDPTFIRDMFLANPDQMAMLRQNNPRLAAALDSNNFEEFSRILRQQQHDNDDRERMRLRMMNADPFDAEAQRLIAEQIRMQNIESNMEAAMEHNPESFGQVHMLYINCQVNGNPVKAFIDSGAQTTLMSQSCAERCNIMRLIDTRWAGIAKGVGTQRIIGRVHLVQIQIEKDFLTSSFSILENQPMDMLLGLDMLRRHQCIIDMNKNVLIIGTTGNATRFLNEAELPPCARLSGTNISDEDEDIARAMNESSKESPKAKKKAGGLGSAPSTGGASSSNRGGIQAGDKFGEREVKLLVDLGFGREAAIRELRTTNGDVNQAQAALLARSLKF